MQIGQVKCYLVNYSLKNYPRQQQSTYIMAPSMQYIRDNWYAICGGRPFVLRKIVLAS